MPRTNPGAENTPAASSHPQTASSGLPTDHEPLVAKYAQGPFIQPVKVTPHGPRWRNVRTYTVQGADTLDYRCIKVSAHGVRVGYWAVQLLGPQLLFTDEV